MIKLSLTSLAVAVGGAALALGAGAGVASADTDLGPMIHTTCTYPQAVAALNAENPGAAALFTGSPQTQAFLHQFIDSTPDQRLQLAHQVQASPVAQPYFPVIQQMFTTCNNY